MARKAGVYGDNELRRVFRQMAKLYGKPVSEASRHALRPILKAAKANTPHRSLKKALVLKKDRRAPKTRPTHVIGGDPKNPDHRLLHLQEFGVDPHKIGEIDHPGHAPAPFLTPAFDQHGKEALRRFGEKLGPALEKQAARLAGQKGRKR